MERRHLKIKLDAFLTALELALDGGDGGWFLDLQSREILLAGDGTEVGLEDVDDDERYLMIGPIASKTGFRMMDEFVAGISDASAAGRLDAALRGRKPFRAFKDALVDFPEHRTAWFVFEKAAHRQQADDWCQDHGITVEWT
jgi:Uncharacterised protein family (UPF0158)